MRLGPLPAPQRVPRAGGLGSHLPSPFALPACEAWASRRACSLACAGLRLHWGRLWGAGAWFPPRTSAPTLARCFFSGILTCVCLFALHRPRGKWAACAGTTRRLRGSKVAQVSLFYTGGVGAFGTIGFTGTMDNPRSPTSRCQACCSAGRLQITGENPHAHVVRAGGLARLTNEKKPLAGPPYLPDMVGRAWGSTPLGGTAVGPPL